MVFGYRVRICADIGFAPETQAAGDQQYALTATLSDP